MNRIGGKSNTGRVARTRTGCTIPSGVARSSKWRPAASEDGSSDQRRDLQIKMAQGAAGEGGQLPGQKVYPWIASTRHSTSASG